jgi:carbonic anhydrase
MRTKRNRGWLLAAAFTTFAAIAAIMGCAGRQQGPDVASTCSILCLAPQEGCHYEGSLTTGPCDKVTCGKVVCEPVCAIRCSAPPEGCHYEGALTTGPCSKVTCGKVVCSGPGYGR